MKIEEKGSEQLMGEMMLGLKQLSSAPSEMNLCILFACNTIRDILLSRLEQSEKSAIEWAKIAGKNQSQIEKLADEIENLKCCGNCNLVDCDTERGNLDYNFGKYCKLWCSDGMSREERMIL